MARAALSTCHLARAPFRLLVSSRSASEVSRRRRDVSSRVSSSAAAACAAAASAAALAAASILAVATAASASAFALSARASASNLPRWRGGRDIGRRVHRGVAEDTSRGH
jgi:hypothetical protein